MHRALDDLPPTVLAIDAHEAGRRCGLHPETIARAARRGELRSAKIGRALRFQPADLVAWLNSKSSAAAPAEASLGS